jgi:hypothetical protein
VIEDWFQRRFPRLKTDGFRITSPRTTAYNCVGWAAEDNENWWSPEDFGLYYWPAGVSRDGSVDAWAAAFASLGFESCGDAELEPDYVRIAIYAHGGTALHAARQLPSGRWTSKLGRSEDIEHDLESLSGEGYGEVVLFMRRRISASGGT